METGDGQITVVALQPKKIGSIKIEFQPEEEKTIESEPKPKKAFARKSTRQNLSMDIISGSGHRARRAFARRPRWFEDSATEADISTALIDGGISDDDDMEDRDFGGEVLVDIPMMKKKPVKVSVIPAKVCSDDMMDFDTKFFQPKKIINLKLECESDMCQMISERNRKRPRGSLISMIASRNRLTPEHTNLPSDNYEEEPVKRRRYHRIYSSRGLMNYSWQDIFKPGAHDQMRIIHRALETRPFMCLDGYCYRQNSYGRNRIHWICRTYGNPNGPMQCCGRLSTTNDMSSSTFHKEHVDDCEPAPLKEMEKEYFYGLIVYCIDHNIEENEESAYRFVAGEYAKRKVVIPATLEDMTDQRNRSRFLKSAPKFILLKEALVFLHKHMGDDWPFKEIFDTYTYRPNMHDKLRIIWTLPFHVQPRLCIRGRTFDIVADPELSKTSWKSMKSLKRDREEGLTWQCLTPGCGALLETDKLLLEYSELSRHSSDCSPQRYKTESEYLLGLFLHCAIKNPQEPMCDYEAIFNTYNKINDPECPSVNTRSRLYTLLLEIVQKALLGRQANHMELSNRKRKTAGLSDSFTAISSKTGRMIPEFRVAPLTEIEAGQTDKFRLVHRLMDRPFAVYNGYTFRVTSYSQSSIHWICRRRATCPGRIKTTCEINRPYEMVVCCEHDSNCPQDILKAEQDYAIGCMIYIARENPQKSAVEIFKQVLNVYSKMSPNFNLNIHYLNDREISNGNNEHFGEHHKQKGIRMVRPSQIRLHASETLTIATKPTLPPIRPEGIVRHDYPHLLENPDAKDKTPLLCYDGRIYEYLKSVCSEKNDIKFVWQCRAILGTSKKLCSGCIRTDEISKNPVLLNLHSEQCKPKYGLISSIYENKINIENEEYRSDSFLLGYRKTGNVQIEEESNEEIQQRNRVKITPLNRANKNSSNDDAIGGISIKKSPSMVK